MSRSSPQAIVEATMAADFLTGVIGVGIDLVDVTAMRALLDAGGRFFRDACWTPTEQHDAEGHADRLASRWAAKEAVMKAIGTGIGDIDPVQIEVRSLPSGAPEVVLHGDAADLARSRGIRGWHVSLTHEASWAVAIAIADGTRGAFGEGDGGVPS